MFSGDGVKEPGTLGALISKPTMHSVGAAGSAQEEVMDCMRQGKSLIMMN